MQCPICGSDTNVSDSTPRQAQTLRKRVCKAQGHRFQTEERRIGLRLTEDVHLRHSGDGQVQSVPFQPERLQDEVTQAVMGRLSEAEIADVVNGAISYLRFEVVPERAKFLEGEEYDKVIKSRLAQTGKPHQGPISAIYDHEVRSAVLRQLRIREHRLAHVLYAMYFEGRRNPMIGRQGWSTAEDVLEWLFSEDAYPDVRTDIPSRPQTSTYEWQPQEPSTHPEFVVKRGPELLITVTGGKPKRPPEPEGQYDIQWPATVRDRGVVGFLESRFRGSIRHAVLGRPNAKTLAPNVAWWVLHDLQGQRRVDSSQLANGVLDCLRRVDDVAYLRWVTKRKDFRAIREFRDEALGLISYPSPGLQFSARGPSHKHVTLIDTDAAGKGSLVPNSTQTTPAPLDADRTHTKTDDERT
ncbi:NrdR family transcriptional regulator [Mycobacterium avium]|uniref:NrdR family transcriptional regulator n=1 Tax=Mycobacterium avium TaxID=1764 RepID=UPI003F53EF06